MSIIIPANSAVSGGFEVANSLIFNSADSAYLNRAGAGGAAVKKMTYSFWVKRGLYGATENIMSFYNSSTDYLRVYFNDSDRINVKQQDGGTTHFQVIPIRQYLDFSAWYHIVIAIDTSQGTAANRVKIYTNGVQETQFDTATYPSQERSLKPEAPKFIGSHSTGNYFDGYMAEFAFIVGTQNAQTDFGEFDDDSGIWKPIDVSGLTFGTNGFYLDFEDSSALGNDANGSNNFTVNNIAATDQATDTCTNNFATLNPLIYITNTGTTLSEGNNKIVTTASAHRNAFGTINVSSGKWYCEIKIDNLGGSHQKVGVSTIDNVEINKGTPSEFSDNASGYAYRSDGQKEGGGGSTSSYGNSFTSGDTLGIAMDLTNLKLYFSKNGTFQNSGNPESGATGTGAAFSLAAGESYIFAINQYGANTSSFNFGSPFFAISSGNTDGSGYGNFEYTVPSGYFSLNTKNLAEYG